MKFLTLFFSLSLLSSATYAKDYKCSGKANPDRGFEHAFKVKIKKAAVGSEIVLSAKGKPTSLGTVTEIVTVAPGEPAFPAILGYMGAEDVSGIPEADLQNVTLIKIFEDTSENEVAVYQFFKNDKQIGGSLSVQGLGTSCL